MAPPGDRLTVCSIDLRVGGEYHYAFVTSEGREMNFRGTFLEVEPPHRTVQTWRFDGYRGVEAVETMALREVDGITTLTSTLAFADRADREHMQKYDGMISSIENVEDYLSSLLTQK